MSDIYWYYNLIFSELLFPTLATMGLFFMVTGLGIKFMRKL